MTKRLTLSLLLAACLAGCATTAPAERTASPGEQNKLRARQFTEEVYNQKRLDRIPEYIAADFMDRTLDSPPNKQGPALLRQQAEASFAAFPDLRFDLLHVMADGDLVSLHWRATGTDAKGPRDPHGQLRRVTLQGQSLWRMRDGQVVEAWDVSDRLAPLLQRGYSVVPPTP
ncbi:ester cyclase [Myxococcaceae bacterium JPH2]|nr:ester cyclase [Myxococcaceae bacterium JPH2]